MAQYTLNARAYFDGSVTLVASGTATAGVVLEAGTQIQLPDAAVPNVAWTPLDAGATAALAALAAARANMPANVSLGRTADGAIGWSRR